MSDLIHLTKRAVEWLAKSPTVYGDFVYHEPAGYYACGAISPVQRWRLERLFGTLAPRPTTKSGVEDVRAAYLGKEYKVVQAADKYRRYLRRYLRVPLTLPTCDHCRVLLDMALQSSCPKSGQYPDVDDQGRPKWVRLVKDTYTAPQVVGRAPGDGPKDKADEP